MPLKLVFSDLIFLFSSFDYSCNCYFKNSVNGFYFFWPSGLQPQCPTTALLSSNHFTQNCRQTCAKTKKTVKSTCTTTAVIMVVCKPTLHFAVFLLTHSCIFFYQSHLQFFYRKTNKILFYKLISFNLKRIYLRNLYIKHLIVIFIIFLQFYLKLK